MGIKSTDTVLRDAMWPFKRSEKNRTMFEIFKQEAEFVTMRSDTHTKKFIKWRGKIYQSGSLKSVFSSVKNEIKPK